MSLDCDIVVLGAGAAGLSLAVRLAEGRHRVLVLDRRAGYSNDRTFCAFAGRPHPFDGAAARAYRYVRVADARGEVVRSAAACPYRVIPGDLFYALALDLLGRAPNVRLSLGVGIGALDAGPDSITVTTDAGLVRARLVVDARGTLEAAPGRADRSLVQRFVGRVVRTERPVFHPDVATLMDFRVPQDLGPHFLYVLPTSAHEALVEDTYFTAADPLRARFDSTLDEALDALRPGAVETVRVEAGALPMSTARPRATGSPRVVPFGLRGAAAKPSTGYAFTFIQRHAERLARALDASDLRDVPRLPPARGGPTALFDAAFLAWLERDPAGAHRGLVDLFAAAPLASVARFLSEEAGVVDHLRVMAAMPTAPMLRATFETRALWWADASLDAR